MTVDTGVVDNDSKWRAYVGENTPDFQDIVFVKGFEGILGGGPDGLAALEPQDRGPAGASWSSTGPRS